MSRLTHWVSADTDLKRACEYNIMSKVIYFLVHLLLTIHINCNFMISKQSKVQDWKAKQNKNAHI